MVQRPDEGVITVLFTDIVGSAALKTSQGDAAAQEIVRGHFDVLRQQVESHGGREVKTLGDGLMATFVSPRSALTSAIAMQRALADGNRAKPPEQQVQVRVGLNAGEAIREDGDIFGSTVDAAARICAKAAGGQILASETVRGIVGAAKELQFRDRGRFRLKGFPDRWRLLEVAWEEEAPAVISAPVLAERTPYVGREEERAELRRLMEQAIAGHGSIVLIRGEPGVGKTRLAQELVLEARKAGMFDATGRCYEMEGAPPYIPVIEMLQQAMRRLDLGGFRLALGENAGELAKILPELRRVYDDIPPPLELPPEQERMYLFNSIREFLERASRIAPQLQILDDLHWADDATLLLLQHQAQYQDKLAILTVATYRDIELDAARPFARTLESLVRQRLAHRIALKPLPEAGVEAMLRALTGQPPPPALVQAIYRETEGNPFFVEEVFQHLLEQGRLLDSESRWRTDLQVGELDVPEGVRLVISRRLERVSEDCRTALTDAAVVGRDFGFNLLQSLTDLDADTLLDAIDEAERANLIISTDDIPAAGQMAEARFRFAHELIRQTLISGLSLPRRQRLHLRVAETVEHVYGKGVEAYAADMAHHLYQAGAGADPAKTSRYLVLAGDQALHSAAFGEALRNFDAAFPLQPEGDRAARADLYYKRGLARRSLSRRWDEALTDWREAAEAYERLGDKDAAGRIFATMCERLLWGLRYEEAAEMAQRGLALLGKRESVDRCRLLSWTGLSLSAAGYYSAGDTLFRRAIAMADRIGDANALGSAQMGKAVHHFCYSQMREAADCGLKGTELLRRAGNLWDLAQGCIFVGYALFDIGRVEESLKVLHEGGMLAARLGSSASSFEFQHALVREGDIDACERQGRAGLERALVGEDHANIWTDVSVLGIAQFWRGRWNDALDTLQKAAKLRPSGALAGIPEASILLVSAYAADKQAAHEILQRKGLAVPRERSGRPTFSPWLMVRAARASGLGVTGLLRVLRESRSMKNRGWLPRSGRPNTAGSWVMLLSAVEALAVMGEREEAAKLYPLVFEALEFGNLFGGFDYRLIDTVAGVSAAAGGKWAKAEEHFHAALRRTEELPHIIEQPEVRRFYARMLLDRNAPGDREKARGLLMEAIEMYEKIGMPKHVEIGKTLLREV